MDSSWLGLGLDDFFTSSRLRSRRRSRVRSRLDDIHFPDFDSAGFRDSLLREFEEFPRKPSAGARVSQPKEQREDTADSGKPESGFDSVRERELRIKLQHCQDENMKLQDVINDLTQVNKRWQKYNSDRQIYVQKLLSTIQDQQEQLNLIGERSCASSSSSVAASLSQGSASSCENEVERLRSVEQKLKEKISILEFQVKAHRDDWEAELNEKRQALKDREAAERKVAELSRELHMFSVGGSGSGESRRELYCQNCGRVTEVDRSPPSRSRMYRTAVHLPCSSSRHSSTTSISTGDEFVLDSKELRRLEGDEHQASSWNIGADDTSYSRCSTVPLVSTNTPTQAPSCSAGNSVSSVPGSPASLKSFVQIPITKSSSAPQNTTNFSQKYLDSFESAYDPPVSRINSSEQFDGTETNSKENVICLRCGEIFPPDMHLKFLDHFPRCQSSRNRLVSRDGTPSHV